MLQLHTYGYRPVTFLSYLKQKSLGLWHTYSQYTGPFFKSVIIVIQFVELASEESSYFYPNIKLKKAPIITSELKEVGVELKPLPSLTGAPDIYSLPNVSVESHLELVY